MQYNNSKRCKGFLTKYVFIENDYEIKTKRKKHIPRRKSKLHDLIFIFYIWHRKTRHKQGSGLPDKISIENTVTRPPHGVFAVPTNQPTKYRK